MRNRYYSVALAGLLLAPMFSAVHAQILDQSNYANQGVLYYANVWSGQTFTPSANTSVGAGFNFKAGGRATGGIATLELWSDIASNTGATLLASGTSAYSLGAYQQSMIDVFWSAVAVAPGAQYFLTVNAPGTLGDLYTTWATPNTYAGGGVWYQNYSGGVDTSPYTNFYSGSGSLTFEEFSATPVTTPEPASIALVATGLAGVFSVARRRRIKVA